MSAWKLYLLHLATFLVTCTGAAYFYLKYMLQNDDPFALVNHPWQPAMLKWHLLVAPLLVLAFGIFLEAHVFGKLNARVTTNRLSGLTSLACFLVMTLSGYGLQVVTADSWRRFSLIVHLASSGLFIAAYLAHLILSVRLKRKDGSVYKKQEGKAPARVSSPSLLNATARGSRSR